MNKIILILTITLFLTAFTFRSREFDPTGTYQMNNIIKKGKEEPFGYSGQILVSKISTHRIVMSFEVNKGAPSYNSGAFIDTLDYDDMKAIYKNPEADSTCKITFVFEENGITVKEETANFNFGCGFGHAVVANGFYKKTSKKRPVFTD